eukprot:TRINITY_DN4742_c0_g1_i4.p1 TRINITY_DN4742_c0_g1~~TRINITY_DN4742_c0_g1_i4.p1  ORF type:complete len:168 (+),score=48.56 TRINITY_DN4742_c0_g1_i4:127-630(+)
MIRRPPRSTQGVSSAASDVYKRQYQRRVHGDIVSPNSQMMQSSSGFGSVANIKSKLSDLEDVIQKMQQTLANFRNDFSNIRMDKEKQDHRLQEVKKDCVNQLNTQLFELDDEMKRHLAHQKAENSRLQQQITQLKGDKTTINENLNKLESEIKDLQTHVGEDEDNMK